MLFLSFQKCRKKSKSNVLKLEKSFSLDIEVFQYSCREPKAALLKRILSPVKYLIYFFKVALRLEDTEFDDVMMNEENFRSGKFVGKMRRNLMLEHLGLLGDEKGEARVYDCVSDTFYKDLWLRQASKNTKIFEDIFHCIPTDNVRNLEENRKYLDQIPLAEIDPHGSWKKIKDIKGYLVLLPLHYLEEENLFPNIFAKEGLVPTITWT